MNFGLFGVGFMGKGILRNVALKGKSANIKNIYAFDVVSNNIDLVKSDPSITIPITASNAKEIVSKCDIIALSLPSEKHCSDLLFGKEGIIKERQHSRKLILDHGTYSKEFVVECSEKAKSVNVAYLDAPVSGGPGGAWEGTLSVMMGGNNEDVEFSMPFLKLYAANVKHFGPVGSGMAAKLINQLLVGVHAQAACEALHLAEKMGLKDIKLLKELLQNSWGQSRILDLVCNDYIQAKTRVENGTMNWSTSIRQNSAAPLRNMKKDFECIWKATGNSIDSDSSTVATNNNSNSHNNDINSEDSEFPLTKITKNRISQACSEEYGLNNAAFASLIELLKPNKQK